MVRTRHTSRERLCVSFWPEHCRFLVERRGANHGHGNGASNVACCRTSVSIAGINARMSPRRHWNA